MRVLVWGREKNWSFWKWLFWGLVIYSALEACAFFGAWMILKRTVREFSGPYIAFIVPGAVIISLVWWLNTWRERGAPLKPLARGWGLSMALFGVACSDAMARFIVTTLIVVVIGYFSGYRTALNRITARQRTG